MTLQTLRYSPPPWTRDRTGFASRASLALAEAIVPGSATIPAADEATVRRAEQVIEGLDPRLVQA